MAVQFPAEMQSVRFRQSLPLWGRWHGASRDGEGEAVCRKVALLGKGVPLGELLSAARLRGYTANHKPGMQKHLPGLLFAIFFTAPRR